MERRAGTTTETFENFPTSATQQGHVTLTAQITPSGGKKPTGTVTFYINGVPINSQNDGATPQVQPVTLNASGVATITALLPALSDGNVTAHLHGHRRLLGRRGQRAKHCLSVTGRRHREAISRCY